jgi:hypothetical protein
LDDGSDEDDYFWGTWVDEADVDDDMAKALTLTRQTPARMAAETPAGTPSLTWRPWTTTAPEFCVF